MNQHTHIAHTLEKHRHTSKGNTPALGVEEGKDQGLSTQAKRSNSLFQRNRTTPELPASSKKSPQVPSRWITADS